MAKDKKSKVQEAKDAVDKLRTEANMENDITKLPPLGGGKKSEGSTSAETTSASGNKKTDGVKPSGKTSGSDSKSNGNTSGGSSTPKSTSAIRAAIDSFITSKDDNAKAVDQYNKDKAEQLGIDSDRGDSNYYISLDTLRREKNDAKKDLENAKKANHVITENEEKHAGMKEALKSNEKMNSTFGKLGNSVLKGLENKKKGLEKGSSGRSSAEIEPEYSETAHQTESVNQKIDELKKSEAWINNVEDPELKARMQELTQQQSELATKRDALKKELEQAESIEALGGQIADLKELQKAVTSDSIDTLLEWVDQNGTDKDKAMADTVRGLRDKVYKFDEDGVITSDEAKEMKSLMSDITETIRQEMKNDKNVDARQRDYDSAKAKYMYYLFNQIASIAAFMIGLSVGSPQVILSAMDQFNKQISDAEAGFRTKNIEAFSNNNIKAITGKSDAQYEIEKILPQFLTEKGLKEMSADDRKIVVEQLERAFEEYQRYVNSGNKGDFATWFTAQQATQNGGGWANLISGLIQAGALNAETLGSFFNNLIMGGSNSKPGTPSKKSGPVSLNTGGKTNDLIQSVLSATAQQSADQMQTDVNSLRSKQDVVNNAVASHLPKAGTQGQALASGKPWKVG